MRVKKILFVLLTVALLAACGGNDAPEVAVPTVIPSHTPLPPATTIPTLSTPLALLILPANLDQPASDLYQKTVYDLALASGFRFQVRNGITPQDLADPTLKVVIALPPDPGVMNYAPTAPNVQFLAVNIPNVTAGGNVSVLAPNTQNEMPAFLAGYTLALLIDEYRIGMVYPEGEPEVTASVAAFNNGARYYCGLCDGVYIDPVEYPAFQAIPPNEDPNKFGGYANILITDKRVFGLYIYPSIASDDLLSYVGSQGVYLIGTSRPEPRPGGWVMTISPDTIDAIETAWPQLIAGQGGQNVQSPLGIEDVDTSILSEAKLRLVQETLDALIAGRIRTTGP